MTATRGDRTYRLHGRVTDRSIQIDGLFDENDDASAGSESFGVDFLATATAYAANHPGMTITTLAGRDKTMNGYSMWPKLGFEAIDPSEFIGDHVPEEAASRMRELATTESGQLSLAKLNTTTEGRLLWKSHGDNIEVYFRPKQDSLGLSIFVDYLKKLRRRIVR